MEKFVFSRTDQEVSGVPPDNFGCPIDQVDDQTYIIWYDHPIDQDVTIQLQSLKSQASIQSLIIFWL